MKQHFPPTTNLAPLPAVIVSVASADGLQTNMLAISWTGIICSNPPMCYISVRPERYSYALLKDSREFAINLTTTEMSKVTDLVGVLSGREVDKWVISGLTPCPGHIINTPLITESPLSLECKVKDIVPLGSHDMFIADIVGVAVEENLLFNGKLDLSKTNLISYSQGHYFSQGDFIASSGWSLKKNRNKK